jgi:hypothetical protein
VETDDLAWVVADTPVPPRVIRVLDHAAEKGWRVRGPGVTLVARLTKDDDPLALPFYVRWTMVETQDGKKSWRFTSAYAKNGQPMNYGDIFTYLDDPAVIHPEPPRPEDDELAQAYAAWQERGGQ